MFLNEPKIEQKWPAMEMTVFAADHRVFLTGRLRWVRPQGTSTAESKLQQEWADETYEPGVSVTVNYEWKDVPLELV